MRGNKETRRTHTTLLSFSLMKRCWYIPLAFWQCWNRPTCWYSHPMCSNKGAIARSFTGRGTGGHLWRFFKWRRDLYWGKRGQEREVCWFFHRTKARFTRSWQPLYRFYVTSRVRLYPSFTFARGTYIPLPQEVANVLLPSSVTLFPVAV